MGDLCIPYWCHKSSPMTSVETALSGDYKGPGIAHNRRMSRPIAPRKTKIGEALTINRTRFGYHSHDALADALNEQDQTHVYNKRTVGRWERSGSIGKAQRMALCRLYGIDEQELLKPPHPHSIDRLLEGMPVEKWRDAEDFVKRFIIRDDPSDAGGN
jgi:hypothetical protein